MIAFSAAHQDWNSQIYLVDEDSQNLRCLTCSSGLEKCQQPLWAPDKSQLIFLSWHETAAGLVPQNYLINLTGTLLQPVFIDPKPSSFMRWLSNGRLLFSADFKDYSGRGYWTAYPDGTKVEFMGNVEEYWGLDVSANGQYIVLAKKEEPDYLNVYDGEGRLIYRLLIRQDGYYFITDYGIAISPDNQKIAYVRDYDFGSYELWCRDLADFSGSSRRKIADVDYGFVKFNWSPDSQHIAYIRSLEEEEVWPTHFEICVADFKTLQSKHVAELYYGNRSGGSWCWTKDSQNIIYSSYLDGGMHLFRVGIESQKSQKFLNVSFDFLKI